MSEFDKEEDDPVILKESKPIISKPIQTKKKSTLINYQDVSDAALSDTPFFQDMNDPRDAAIHFLDNFEKDVTYKDPETKKFKTQRTPFYRSLIKSMYFDDIRIMDIDYLDLTDWLNECRRAVEDIVTKYNFNDPFVDHSLLAKDEKFSLYLYMHTKKLVEYLDRDRVAWFIRNMKEATLFLYKKHWDPELDFNDKSNMDVIRPFLNTHIGVKNFTNSREIFEIKSDYINKAVVIKGTLLVFDEKTRVEVIKSAWHCNSCQLDFMVRGALPPKKCPSCDEMYNFEDLNKYEARDYIYIKIQQHGMSDTSQLGMTDFSIRLEGPYLIEAFNRKIKQNNALKITGIVKLSTEIINKSNKDEKNLQLDALTVEVEGENAIIQYDDKLLDTISRLKPANIEKHYEKLERSIAPHLYGLIAMKSALLLMAVGGVARVDSKSRYRVRGDINMALLGDSGVGKSELARFIKNILPLSILTVGGKKTTTASALTTTYEFNNNVKQIVSGVLPRCDRKGVAIIDELDKRDTEDLQVLSIPMDDNQTIPTHKGTFHSEIPARCPVLLVGNTTKKSGKWNETQTIFQQTTYPTWLVSRCDLIFVIVDNGDIRQKEQMIQHMAKSRTSMVNEFDYNRAFVNKQYPEALLEKLERDFKNDNFDGIYDVEYLRHEVHWLKVNFRPLIKPGSDAEQLLKKEYLKFSQITMLGGDENGKEGNFTQQAMDARAYNALERLSMAVASIRRHHVVTVQDMEKALNLMYASLISMMPKPSSDNDKLVTSDMAIYKSIQTAMRDPSERAKMFERENTQWSKYRKEQERKYLSQLRIFHNTLSNRGYRTCKACENGKVYVETGKGLHSETCTECSGIGTKRPQFTKLDTEADILNNQQYKKHFGGKEFDTWWQIFYDKKIIQHASRSTFRMSLERPDPIYMSEFIQELAEMFANNKVEEEKKRYMDGEFKT